MNNTELCGFTSKTRKPCLTSPNATNSRHKYNRICLQFPHRYAILVTSQREETNYGGNDDGKISNRKRNSRNAESVRRYYHQTAATEETCGLQSRELLEDKRGRLTGVLGQAEEYPRQKIKPAHCWQTTTNKIVATDLPLTDSAPEEASLNTRYSVFSIVSHGKSCQEADKTMLKMWVRVESVYVPMEDDNKYTLVPPTEQERLHLLRKYHKLVTEHHLRRCNRNAYAAITIRRIEFYTTGEESDAARKIIRLTQEHTILSPESRFGYADLVINGYFTFPSDLKNATIDDVSADLKRIREEILPPILHETRKEAKRVNHHLYRASRVAQAATLTLDQWTETLNFYNWRCALCPTGNYEVLEHFVPIICGGGTTAYNCIPACASCNGKKNDMHPQTIPAEKAIAKALYNAQQYLDIRREAENEVE